jgi:hypothetical protein
MQRFDHLEPVPSAPRDNKDAKPMTHEDLDRGFASVARAAAMAMALCLGFGLTSAVAGDQAQTPSPAMTPAPKGEFDNSCAMGLASGQVVKTDCSVNWTGPDGKVYCFSTAESKATFSACRSPGGGFRWKNTRAAWR